MATSGDRYEERTGNIWSYSHRGDMSGLRAALSRGVCPNMSNTVGWTPSHAAAAGGHTKALRLLAKSGADFTIADRGGNLPAHQAAKNGHVHALRVLSEHGADITKVRLSQAKGKAARDFVIDAYKKAGVDADDEDEEEDAPVGYSRKQVKSTAFWGPRRTPISTKIKKKIIKEKRLKKKEKAQKCDGESEIRPQSFNDNDNNKNNDTSSDTDCNNEEASYVETVRQMKRNKKQRQKQMQGRKETAHQTVVEEQDSNTIDDDQASATFSSDDSTDDSMGVNGFAALLLGDDSDSE
ncbi:hypothetical protein QTG54_014867 [Skeletonema marinoi]|uniref:Uncharacterized protein n=1 Tax=Skeletonema marinoi TaxID=267567 RepID=A0AAD8XVP6_9STRA|nr:hypothetical protein QTG54_014867 [Skeletonema marinoi]